jgi:hypothetical protein
MFGVNVLPAPAKFRVKKMKDTTYRGALQVQTSRPTLAEVADSRPPRGSGAPSRTRSHYDRILALLRERGSAGVLSSELYDAPHLFGRSPRNRISELRKDGHLIQTIPAGASIVRYTLIHENPSPTPRSAQSRRPEQADLADSSDWYERETGHKRQAAMPSDLGPLFTNLGEKT